MHIGTGELIVVLVVALIIFGPSKLPALGKMAGKAVGTLRHYADSNNWDELLEEEEEEEEKKSGKKQEEKSQKQTENEQEAEPVEEPAEEAEQAEPAEEVEQPEQAKEMTDRVYRSGDYGKALSIISEYVETELTGSKPVKPKERGTER